MDVMSAWGFRYYHAHMRHGVYAFALILLLIGCKTKQHESSDLRALINVARTSQYCHQPEACFNPHILVVETEYDITAFAGSKPYRARVHPQGLRDYLLALPMNAWPQGPIIGITPSDDVMDWPSIQRNLEQAQAICRSLSLDVQLHPGG